MASAPGGAASTQVAAGDGSAALATGVDGVDVFADGSVVLAGTVKSPAQLVLVQYAPSGTAESGFGDNGIVKSSDSGVPVRDAVLAPQDDGSIVVAGNSEKGQALVRFNNTGGRDMSFHEGQESVDLGGDGTIVAVATDMADVLLMASSRAGGNTHEDLVVLRFDGSGEQQMDFGGGGLARTKLSGDRGFGPVAIAVSADRDGDGRGQHQERARPR